MRRPSVPWRLSDVPGKTKKATTPKLKRMWLDVANGELAKHGDEKRAIMAANGVIAKAARKKR
jgi:hypothetical protein